MRKTDFKKTRIDEGLADLAQQAESDHEVQMARAELYKLAKGVSCETPAPPCI